MAGTDLKKKVDLSVEFCGVKFPNPFVLDAAPPTDKGEMIARGFEAGWGGAVVKTLGLEHVEVDLVSPMMAGLSYEDKNLIGLENIDLISDRDINRALHAQVNAPLLDLGLYFVEEDLVKERL